MSNVNIIYQMNKKAINKIKSLSLKGFTTRKYL